MSITIWVTSKGQRSRSAGLSFSVRNPRPSRTGTGMTETITRRPRGFPVAASLKRPLIPKLQPSGSNRHQRGGPLLHPLQLLGLAARAVPTLYFGAYKAFSAKDPVQGVPQQRTLLSLPEGPGWR